MITDNRFKEVDGAINQATWKVAKSYEKSAPHEYIRSWEQPEVYEIIKKCVDDFGVLEEWKYGKKYKYFYHKDYQYFYIKIRNLDTRVILNRAKVKQEKSDVS